MDIKIIYEDNDVLVIDKPAGLVVFPEGEALKSGENTLIDYLIGKYPSLKEAGQAPRYGIAHRLDKNTSGVLLVAKTTEALKFLQNQFSSRGGLEKTLKKSYIVLVEGLMERDSEEIKTLIARAKNDPRKQKVYSLVDAPKSAREAITKYKTLQRFSDKNGDYSLLEVAIETGRKHQIRCHMAYLKHPVTGDRLYSFKNSKIPAGLTRQFLHSSYLKIKIPNGEKKEFNSSLPEDLKKVLDNLK